MISLKKIPVHHIFLSIYPILFLANYNIKQISARVMIIPLIIVLLSALGLWLGLSIILKNKHKSALIISAFSIIFFSFGHFHEGIALMLGLQGSHTFMIISALFYLLIFICIIIPTIKTKSNLKNITYILNVISYILITIITFQLIVYKPKEQERSGKFNTISLKGIPRDIYYIILDGYGRADVLNNVAGFDNSKFIKYLESKGFFIAKKSSSNYPHTLLSLSSSLNMDYLEGMGKTAEIKPYSKPFLKDRIITNQIIVNLKNSHTYKFLNLSSGWGATDHNPYADQNIGYIGGANEFTMVLANTSLLKLFFFDIFLKKRLRVLNAFDFLSKHTLNKDPEFILSHIMSPHPPNIFGPNGEKIEKHAKDLKSWSGGTADYINELKFINKKVMNFVNEILNSYKNIKPIIIIQADHGSGWEYDLRKSKIPEDDFLKQKTSILNAYFIPEECRSKLYDSITPVNSFRVIFNCIFGTDLEMLEDRIYWSPIISPFKLTDVTEKLKNQ